MLVLNGVSHPRSTNRSYLLRSTLHAVYFSPAAGDYSSKQLDVFVLHDHHLFRKPWLDQAAECSSTSRREQPETSESTPKGDGLLTGELDSPSEGEPA